MTLTRAEKKESPFPRPETVSLPDVPETLSSPCEGENSPAERFIDTGEGTRVLLARSGLIDRAASVIVPALKSCVEMEEKKKEKKLFFYAHGLVCLVPRMDALIAISHPPPCDTDAVFSTFVVSYLKCNSNALLCRALRFYRFALRGSHD